MIAIKTSKRNGKAIGALAVKKDDDILMITDSSTLMRTSVSSISKLSRNTQGVRLVRLVPNTYLGELVKATIKDEEEPPEEQE